MAESGAIYAFVLVPTITEVAESGEFHSSPRAVIANIVVSGLVLLLAHSIRRSHSKLAHLASRDPLTGLRNRRMFHLDLDRETQRALRQGTQLALGFIDIDHFKHVNDTHGHERGDAVLKELAGLCERSIRDGVDACYRIGGDEFAILLPSPNAEQLTRATDRILSQLDVASPSVSIGFALLKSGEQCADLLRRADAAMYACKKLRSKSSSSFL